MHKSLISIVGVYAWIREDIFLKFELNFVRNLKKKKQTRIVCQYFLSNDITSLLCSFVNNKYSNLNTGLQHNTNYYCSHFVFFFYSSLYWRSFIRFLAITFNAFISSSCFVCLDGCIFCLVH